MSADDGGRWGRRRRGGRSEGVGPSRARQSAEGEGALTLQQVSVLKFCSAWKGTSVQKKGIAFASKPRPPHSAPPRAAAMPPKAKPICMYENCDAPAVRVCIARCGRILCDAHGSLIDPGYVDDAGGKWYQACNACDAAVCQHCGGGEGLGIPCSYSLINGNNKCEGCARNKRPAKRSPRRPRRRRPRRRPRRKTPRRKKKFRVTARTSRRRRRSRRSPPSRRRNDAREEVLRRVGGTTARARTTKRSEDEKTTTNRIQAHTRT